jgi:hypothetical protein
MKRWSCNETDGEWIPGVEGTNIAGYVAKTKNCRRLFNDDTILCGGAG